MLENWKLKDFTPGEGVVLRAYTEEFETDDWIDITVPGDSGGGNSSDTVDHRAQRVVVAIPERHAGYHPRLWQVIGTEDSECSALSSNP